MTKEEYEKLLQSDYWRGFSYSLIKERNFTCEDCGRVFYNQRNKLQVHHLVYRDINPWSYRPEEMVVLCEECHKKRHGLWQEPVQEANATNSHNTFEDYTQSDSYSIGSREDGPRSYIEAERWGYVNGGNGAIPDDPYPVESQSWFKWKYIICGILLLFPLFYVGNRLIHDSSNNPKEIDAPATLSVDDNNAKEKVSRSRNSKKHKLDVSDDGIGDEGSELAPQSDAIAPHTDPASEITQSEDVPVIEDTPSKRNVAPQKELSTIELLEKKNHARVVEQAKRAGVSTEGSTIDILDRINHAEVVEQAKRAGVSTEGSTIDILDRINRKRIESMN